MHMVLKTLKALILTKLVRQYLGPVLHPDKRGTPLPWVVSIDNEQKKGLISSRNE